MAAPGFQSKLPNDVLSHCYTLIRRDLDRFDMALQAFDPARDWHIHNFGEFWMVWLEIFSAHQEHEAKLFVPAVPGVNPETVKALQTERTEIMEFVKRVTYHLVNLRDAPRSELVFKTAILLKLKEVFLQFSSRVREHILSAEKALLPGWKALGAGTNASVAAAIAKDTAGMAQWWMPWYTNEFSDDALLEFLQGLPTCCASGTQLNFWRYYRPQWKSRMEPLLVSIFDRSVKSPTEKDAPNLLWCCLGFDEEDPQSSGCCISVPRIRKVPVAPKATPAPMPKPAAAAPAAAAPKPAAAPAQPVVAAPPAAAPATLGAGASVSVAANKPAAAAPAPAPAAAAAPAATAAQPKPAAAAAPAAPATAPVKTSDPVPTTTNAAAPAPAPVAAAAKDAAAASAKDSGEVELKKVEASSNKL